MDKSSLLIGNLILLGVTSGFTLICSLRDGGSCSQTFNSRQLVMRGQMGISNRHGDLLVPHMRTILDLLEGGEVPLAILRQALREGLRRGLIRRSEIAEARKHLADSKQLRAFFRK
jgi:hypothetical protein